MNASMDFSYETLVKDHVKKFMMIPFQVWFQNTRAKSRRMNAQGQTATLDQVLAGDDDDMKAEEVSPEVPEVYGGLDLVPFC